MNCSIKLKESPTMINLKKDTHSEAEFNSFYAIVSPIGENDCSSKFKDWFKETYKKDFDITTTDENQIKENVEAIKKRYSELANSGRTTARGNLHRSTKSVFYASVNDREESILMTVDRIISDLDTNPIPKEARTADEIIKHIAKLTGGYYNRQIKSRILKKTVNERLAAENITDSNELARRKGEITEEVKKELKQELNDIKAEVEGESQLVYNNAIVNYYAKKLGIDLTNRNNDSNTSNLADRNIIALYREIMLSTKSFFAEIGFRNSKINKLFSKAANIDKYYQDSVDAMNVELEEGYSDETNESIENDFDRDTTLADLENHAGLYSDFLKHVDDELKKILSLVPNITDSSNLQSYDLNNALGLPSYMPFELVNKTLFTTVSKISKEQMIEDIEELAIHVTKFAGFKILADKMRKDESLANRIFRVYSKTVIPKTITYTTNGSTVITSNSNIEPLVALSFEFYNSLQTTMLMDLSAEQQLLSNIRKSFGTINKAKQTLTANTSIQQMVDNQVNLITEDLVKIAKKLFPTIDYVALRNYINDTKDIETIFRQLESAVNMADKVKDRYDSEQLAIANAIGAKNYTEASAIRARGLNNVKYTQGLYDMAKTVASTIVDYCFINPELNHRNALNNLSSDIVNDSWITSRIAIVNDPLALQLWGEQLYRSRQFDYSNFVIEHRDSTGRIINFGLFKKTSKGFVPTDYAQDMLKLYLFDGAKVTETNNATMYSTMPGGDYIANAYHLFTKGVSDERFEALRYPVARYFLRTPSDAPRNFSVRMPRYSVEGLVYISGEKEVRSEVKEIANAFAKDHIYVGKVGNQSTKLSKATFEKILNGDKTVKLKANPNTFVIVSKGVAVASYTYDNIIIQVEGDYNVETNDLINPKFKGFSNDTGKVFAESEVAFDMYKELGAKRAEVTLQPAINTSHVIFQQFKNEFLQELVDMRTALSIFFEMDGDIIKTKDGKLVFNNGFTENSGKDNEDLFEFYHYGKDGKVFKKNDDGTLDIGNGNVFKSTKFTVKNEKDGTYRNYGEEIIKRAFALLPFDSSLRGSLKYSRDYIHTNADGSIKLTVNQERVVNELMEEFILDYIEDSRNDFNKSEQFVSDVVINTEVVDEMNLNYYLAYLSFDKIFEGDIKFYKDTPTFIKRAKEIQGSGVPYGCKNYRRVQTLGEKQLASNEETGVSELDAANIVHQGRKVEMYNGYNAVTIYNSIYGDQEVVDTMSEKLIAIYKKEGYTEKEAKKKAADIMLGVDRKGGYTNYKANDAQSYITFEEWIRRIAARGQLKSYLPLINKILDEDSVLEAKELDVFVQVQKNFGYDMPFNEGSKVVSPRQIKNAEFVLVPRFIKGTELEAIYDAMIEGGIDQLNTAETSKAAKTNIYRLWDDNGNLNESDFNAFKAGLAVKKGVETFDYSFLYTQQETVQHINGDNKVGIQVVKKLLDNIPNYSETLPDNIKHLAELKKEFLEIEAENIFQSYVDLCNELSIPLKEDGSIDIDENGNIKGLSYTKYFERLRQDARRQGLDSNAIDFLTLVESSTPLVTSFGPSTAMPLVLSPMIKKLENMSQSMFNNAITRQTMHGYHAVQVSNFGLRSIDKTPYKLISEVEGKSKELSVEEYKKLSANDKLLYKDSRYSVSKDLKYHPNGSSFIEIKLPYSAFAFKRYHKDGTLKTDEELLKELQDAKLDEHIIYRIPTEGKQSASIAKVVGFIDDSLGSTIMVPHEWVAQTGADFDIDSIYAMMFSTYIDKNGNIQKIQYKTSATENDWYRYINRYLYTGGYDRIKTSKEDIEAIKKNAKETAKLAIKEKRKDFINGIITAKKQQLQIAEKNAYENLDKTTKIVIKKLHKQLNKIGDIDARTYVSDLETEIELLKRRIETYKKDYTKEELKNIGSYMASLSNIVDNIVNREKIELDFSEDYFAIKDEAFLEGFEEHKNSMKKLFEETATELGLLNQEEFEKAYEDNPIKANDKSSRNNRWLDIMLEILGADECLEENLSRSNFDDLIAVRDSLYEGSKKSALRKQRNPYNFYDIAAYQSELMAGRVLKGMSVSLDTMNSVSNAAHAELTVPIYAIYDLNEYSEKEIKKAFPSDKIYCLNNNKLIVEHDRLAWSENNRNIEGKLITPYSSQTTAHILDIAKKGPIENVNTITFPTFKLFASIGSDYATSVSFMGLPAMNEICKAIDENNSIYARGDYNYIHTAMKRIAIRMGVKINNVLVDEFRPIDLIIANIDYEKLNKVLYGNDLNSIKKAIGFDVILANSKNLDEVGQRLPINRTRQENRINERGEFASSPVEGMSKEEYNAYYDFITLLQYNAIAKNAGSISSIASKLNPDSFGAKPTMYASAKMFDGIYDLLDKQDDTLVIKKDDGYVSLIEAIYPGIISSYKTDENTGFEIVDREASLNHFISNDFGKQSVYPPLYYFLRCSTATSLKVNRNLFITQLPQFRERVNAIQKSFSIGKKLDEQTYNEFERYILNRVYQQCELIADPITYDTKLGLFVGRNDYSATAQEAIYNESRRISGIGYSEDLYIDAENEIEFSPIDKNNPTQEEIDNFAKFTPAQKVLWLQQNFSDSLICNYIITQLHNVRGSYTGYHTMRLNEGFNTPESMFKDFRDTMFNENPLFALTALDLIKYAFVVEGFKHKANTITKVIANETLQNTNSDGENIVDEILQQMYYYQREELDDNGLVSEDNIHERYIRSHYNSLKQINECKIPRIKDGEGHFRHEIRGIASAHGLIVLPAFPDYFADGETDKNKKVGKKNIHILKKLKIFAEIQTADGRIKNVPNKYIKLIFEGVKNNSATLYRIERRNRHTYLIPLNALENNENIGDEWSINQSNNIHPSKEYYLSIINKYESLAFTDSSISISQFAETDENKKLFEENIKKTDEDTSVENRKISLNKYSRLKEQIENNYKYAIENALAFNYYFLSSELAELNMKLGRKHSVETSITIDGQIIPIIIERINGRSFNRNYLAKENKAVEKGSMLDSFIKTSKAKGREFKADETTLYRAIIKPISIEDETNSSMGSSLGLMAVKPMYGISNDINTIGDQLAINAKADLNAMGIISTEESIDEKLKKSYNVLAAYAKERANKIVGKAKYFTSDDNGNFYAINDLHIVELMQKDNNFRNEFEDYMLMVDNFLSHYKEFEEYHTGDTNPDIVPFINIIKDAIKEVKDTTIIKDAFANYINDFIASKSNNPMIKAANAAEAVGLKIGDGYYATSFIEKWVGDIQENPNPIIQIITKEVESNLIASRILGKKRAKRFVEQWDAIIEEARKHGAPINIDDLITEDGKLIPIYNDKLMEDYNKLIEARDAIEDKNSIEYFRAKIAIDEFKLNNFEQKLVDSYYLARLKLNKEFAKPENEVICSEYLKLIGKEKELYDRVKTEGRTKDLMKQIFEIRRTINDLKHTYIIYPGSTTIETKLSYSHPENPIQDARKRRLLSIESARALKAYIEGNTGISKKYYKQEELETFRKELQKRLNVINAHRILTMNANSLDNAEYSDVIASYNEEYQEALDWINRNAKYSISEDIDKKIKKAFETMSKKRSSITGNIDKIKLIINKADAYDEFGVVDGTKLSLEEIEEIRKIQEESVMNENGGYMNENNLIKCCNPNNTVYNSEFYTKLSSNSEKSKEYKEVVKKINAILINCYNPIDKQVRTSELSIEELNELKSLYDELDAIVSKEYKDKKKDKNREQELKELGIVRIPNTTLWKQESARAFAKGQAYFKVWQSVNTVDKKGRGSKKKNGTRKTEPNKYIYQYLTTTKEKYINKEKTKAMRLINAYTERVTTPYYKRELAKYSAMSKKEYQKWFDANHVYNPFTHKVEPLQCWTRFAYKQLGTTEDGQFEENAKLTVDNFEPIGEQVFSLPRKEYLNPNYDRKVTIAANYKKPNRDITSDKADLDRLINGEYIEEPDLVSGGTKRIYSEKPIDGNIIKPKYDRPRSSNEYLEKLRDLIVKTTEENAKSYGAKKFFAEGYLPYKSLRKESTVLKKVTDFVGFTGNNGSNVAWVADEDIDYSKNTEATMPYLTSPYMVEPVKERFIKNGVFDEERYNEVLEKVKEHNANVQLDRNYRDIIAGFVEKAAEYNSIREDRRKLFMCKKMLQDYKVFRTSSGVNKLIHASRNADDETSIYAKDIDDNAIKQFNNFIRRLVYQVYKEDHGVYTKIANASQTFSSSKFMMFNIHGGIANVTVGLSQIIAEAGSKDNFDISNWRSGMNFYYGGVFDYINHAYDGNYETLQGQLIELFNVIDYDQIRGLDAKANRNKIDKFRAFAYSPQTSGEHLMQNGVLFAVLDSHRIVLDPSAPKGEPKYKAVNRRQYIADCYEQTLLQLLDDTKKQKYREFVEEVLSDPNIAKDYATFKKNLVMEFVLNNCSLSEIKQFGDIRESLEKEKAIEFEKLPKVIDQFGQDSNGELKFVDDSLLNELTEEEQAKFIGIISQKVVSINKKIHGVYDKLGSGLIEKTLLGGLAMQFHKHLWPGIMKRYRVNGMYNESRDSVETGWNMSLIRFLALPLKYDMTNAEGLTKQEYDSIKALQNIFGSIFVFARNIKSFYRLLPDYEQANIRRWIYDWSGLLASLLMYAGVYGFWDKDKKKENSFNNNLRGFCLYEASRLNTESWMWNPFGAITEAKTLWGSPMAAKTAIDDIIQGMGLMTEFMFNPEFDATYTTGIHKGENKFIVRLERNIPIYRSIDRFFYMDKSNRAYKIGEAGFGAKMLKDLLEKD